MEGLSAQEFDRFLAAPAARQVALARGFAGRGLDWPTWTAQFNRAYGQSPQQEAHAARLLCHAYRAAGDRLTAARMRLMEARAVHRAGSPAEAVRMFARASRELHAAGDPQRALQAGVVRIDALAHSGRVREALRTAKRLRPRLTPAWAKSWRHVLDVNVANALRLRGDLDDALRRYESAARGLLKAGQGPTAAIARMNAGVALLDAGRGEEALERFEAAERDFQAVGLADMALEARYNRACAAVQAARLGEGVTTLERLAQEHHERGLTRREGLCRMDLAVALLRAGDADSAREEAERSAEAFAASDAKAERCEALLLAGAAARTPSAAAHLLRSARSAARGSDRPAVALRCDLLVEDHRLRTGRPAPAALQRIVKRAVLLGRPEIAAEARLLLGTAALEAGKTPEARRHFSLAGEEAPGRPWIRAGAQGGLAACLAREGRRSEALTALRRVADFLDTVRSDLPGPWLRATFVLGRLDPWLARVDLLLERGNPADRREAEALLDALAARRFQERARPRSADHGPLARLRRRLEALYDRLGRGGDATRGTTPAELASTLTEARRIEQRLATAWRAAERSGRGAPGVRTTRARPAPLGEGEAALHVWVRAGQVLGLVRSGRDVGTPLDLGPVAGLEAEAQHLEFLADRVRLFGAEDGDDALRERLQSLGARLLAPLSAAPVTTRLHLVLDPQVPDLSWEVLPWEGRPLASVLPLLRVPALRVRAPRAAAPDAAERVTFLAADEADLPGLAEEARGLRAGASLLLGAQATRAALSDALAKPGVVHVAGHGFSSPEAPPLGGVRLADGWFSATDLPPQVRARVVVLGACRTGHDQGVPARAWGGLPAALLGSGARRVLWTATDVDDRSTAALTVAFHRALATQSPEQAFGSALSAAGEDRRVAACLLPFRLSGILP